MTRPSLFSTTALSTLYRSSTTHLVSVDEQARWLARALSTLYLQHQYCSWRLVSVDEQAREVARSLLSTTALQPCTTLHYYYLLKGRLVSVDEQARRLARSLLYTAALPLSTTLHNYLLLLVAPGLGR